MSFRNEYTLNVDIKKRMANVVPIFLKGDTAKLNFRVYDNGILYDLTDYTRSEISFQLPSGQTYVNNCELVNGLIEYTFIGVEMAEIGDLLVTVTIYSGIDRVSIQPFSVHIVDNMRGEDLSYISILQDLIKQVQDLELEVLPLKNEIEQLVQDFTEMYEEVEENEQARSIAESQRINDENLRVSNEQTRTLAEQSRLEAEGLRLINEANRVNAENLRVIAEQARANAELLRIQGTNERFENFDFIIANLDYKGNYNPEVQYHHYNVVFYEGSSYVAQRDVVGIPPNDLDIDWSMLARKGLDGQGAVQSVNGYLPDANGNITLPGTEVVDNLISFDTTKALSANKGRELKGLVDNKVLRSDTQPTVQSTNDIWFDISDTAIQSIDIVNAEFSATPPIDFSKLWLKDEGQGSITIMKYVMGEWITLYPKTTMNQVTQLLETLNNKVETTVFNVLSEDVDNLTAKVDNRISDGEYQNANVIGAQIRLVKHSNSNRLFFKLSNEVDGNITISLDNGTTVKPLLDIDDNQVTNLPKGFQEIVEGDTFFTLRNKGGISNNQLQALIAGANEVESNSDSLRSEFINAYNDTGLNPPLESSATWNDILINTPNIIEVRKKYSTGTNIRSDGFTLILTNVGFNPSKIIGKNSTGGTNEFIIDTNYNIIINNTSVSRNSATYVYDSNTGNVTISTSTINIISNINYDWIAYE